MKPVSLSCVLAVLFSAVLLAQSNPVPLINNPLVPTSVAPGGPSFTLTVSGTGFVPGAVVNWNGRPRTTHFVSGSQLRAAIRASDISSARTASVTVVNPQIAVESNVVFFPVSQTTSSVIFNKSRLPRSMTLESLASADFNGDGVPDLAVGDNALSVEIVLANGDGSFQPAVQYATGAVCNGMVFGDFNGDGNADLACVGQVLSVLLGNGDGTFQAHVDENIVGSSAATADFDRDGKLDLAVVQNGSAGNVQILHGGGDGTFSPFGSYQIGFYTFAVGIGDFNADDQLDLAISSGGNDKVYVVLGNGDGTFQQPAPYRTGGFPSGILTADLNGDDELDLVNTNFQQRAVSVLVGNGDGTFQGHTDFPTGRSAKLVVAADLNSDGKLDLVTGDTYTNAPDISVLLGNGDATFQPPLSIAKIRGEGLVVGDFNRDGKLDLAAEDNGHVTIFLQTSTADRAEGKLPTVQ